LIGFGNELGETDFDPSCTVAKSKNKFLWNPTDFSYALYLTGCMLASPSVQHVGRLGVSCIKLQAKTPYYRLPCVRNNTGPTDKDALENPNIDLYVLATRV
jgi:hypothetical protein